MTSDDEPDTPLSREALHDQAVRFLLAMLRSASTDEIAPRDWWRRAQAALEWGASTASTYHEMRARMAESLEIQAPTKRTAQEASSIYSEISAHDQFQQFRRLCENQAFAVTSDAQVVRERERDDYQEQEKDDIDFADPFGLASEMGLPSADETQEDA